MPKIGQNSEFSSCSVCFYSALEQRAEMSRHFFWVGIVGEKKKPTKNNQQTFFLAKSKHFAWHFQTEQNISTFLKSKCFWNEVKMTPKCCFKSLQCSNCAFPLCYSILGYVVWKFNLCSLHAWIVWVVSCLKTLKTHIDNHPCTRQKKKK